MNSKDGKREPTPQKAMRVKANGCGTIGAEDDMLLSLVLLLLTTLFLLLFPCDRGKETQHRVTSP